MSTKTQNAKLKTQNYSSKLKNVALFIDTSSNEEVLVGAIINEEKHTIKKRIGRERAQVVLPMIDKLLKKHQLKLQDVSSIRVNSGPGSFTGLRVGVSIANALGFILSIPVNGKKQIVTPVYE